MMEWEEHLREMAQTAVEHPEYKMLAWFTAKDAVAEIDRLRSGLSSLTAECQKWREYHDCMYRERKRYQQDANHFAGEVQRLTAELKEKEREVERLQDEVRDACGYAHDMESLAASRLADQEAIERHVTKRVAGECAEIAEAMWSDHYWAWPAMQTYADKIRKKYGVTEQ